MKLTLRKAQDVRVAIALHLYEAACSLKGLNHATLKHFLEQVTGLESQIVVAIIHVDEKLLKVLLKIFQRVHVFCAEVLQKL